MKVLRFFVLLLVFFLLTPHVLAFEFIENETAILPEGKTIDGSLFMAGRTVRVEGRVNGDLFCAGQDVEVTGVVTGDILCAGQTIHIASEIQGDARVAGQLIDISGYVGGNVTSFSQTLRLLSEGAITGDLGLGAQSLRLEGSVGKDVYGAAETAEVEGSVGRNLTLTLDRLTLSSGATVAGNVEYTSRNSASISQEANVSGTVSRKDPPPSSSGSRVVEKSWKGANTHAVRGGTFVIVSLLLGGLFVFFFPKYLARSFPYLEKQLSPTFLRGILFVIVLPIVLVLFILTIIGIPLAVLVILASICAYFFGRVLFAMIIGRALLSRLSPLKKESLGWSLISGVLVSWAAFSLPVVGGFISLIATLFGFGIVVTLLFRKKSTSKV